MGQEELDKGKMMEHRTDYQDTGLAVELAKQACSITTPNPEMSDEEIRTVCRWLAEKAPDTIWVDSEPKLGRMGIGVLVSVALYEFPDFYEKYDLSQFN